MGTNHAENSRRQVWYGGAKYLLLHFRIHKASAGGCGLSSSCRARMPVAKLQDLQVTEALSLGWARGG